MHVFEYGCEVDPRIYSRLVVLAIEDGVFVYDALKHRASLREVSIKLE